MNDEPDEPLPMLLFRLSEARRKRLKYFVWGAIFAAANVVHFILRAPASENLGAIIAGVLAGGTGAFLKMGLLAGSDIRPLREKIAWAQAKDPHGSQAVDTKGDLAAWLTFAGSVIAAVGSLIGAFAGDGA